MVQATQEAIRELMEKSGIAASGVAALCMDGMISGTLGVDAGWNATTPYTTPLDMRFAPQLNDAMDRHHDVIRRKTGSGMAVIGPKIAWVRDAFPDAYARTERFVTATGYVAGKVAGLKAGEAFVDFTHLWTTGLSDTLAYAWSDELCEALGVPVEKLPRIVKPTDIIGHVDSQSAAATGLAAGTPIVAGAGDQTAGFVGAGLVRPNRICDVAGTYPIIAFCTDTFRPDMEGRAIEIFPSPIPGLFNPCSAINGGGLTHDWFKETFGRADEEEGAKSGRSGFAVLDERAAELPPGSDNLFFNPHLGGRICPVQTNFKGAWLGFTWTHRREHFYRAVLESIAYDQALAFRRMRRIYPEVTSNEILVFGGGARSSLWNQIKADVMGVPYVALEQEDLAALGDAIIAGCALGIYDDMAATAEQLGRKDRRFEPSEKNHRRYETCTAYYADMLRHLAPAYDALAALGEGE
jgi:xylulokinase